MLKKILAQKHLLCFFCHFCKLLALHKLNISNVDLSWASKTPGAFSSFKHKLCIKQSRWRCYDAEIGALLSNWWCEKKLLYTSVYERNLFSSFFATFFQKCSPRRNSLLLPIHNHVLDAWTLFSFLTIQLAPFCLLIIVLLFICCRQKI